MATYTPSLREALNDSIPSGKFTDTKIILFSRRDPSGNICKPRALYANSHVLKSVPYFNDRKPSLNSLTSDSVNNTLQVLFGAFAEAESKDFSEPVDESECAGCYGYYSDSDLEEDEDHPDSKDIVNQTGPVRGHPFDPFCFSLTQDEPAPTDIGYNDHLEKGKVIKIQDMAFITQVLPRLHCNTPNDPTGSKHFYYISTLARSSSRRTDRRTIASQGVPRSFWYRRTQSLDRPRSQFIDSQTRFPPLLLC